MVIGYSSVLAVRAWLQDGHVDFGFLGDQDLVVGDTVTNRPV